MLRLIDADEINNFLKEMREKETGAFAKGYNKALLDVKSTINNSEQVSTAYDIDKVVKELEEKISDMNFCEYRDALIDVIEIVKHGGVEKDVKS